VLGKLSLGGVAVSVVYVLLRQAYWRFYDPLGTTPEQVGLSKATILVQSAFGVPLASLESPRMLLHIGDDSFLAHGVGAWVFPVLFVGLFLFGVLTHLRLLAWATLLSYLALGLWMLVGFLPTQAGRAAVDAQYGAKVFPFTIAGAPYLSTSAVPVTVTWNGGSPPGPFLQADYQCLLLLGEADGSVVLWNWPTQESVRIPQSAVTISQSRVRPASCQPIAIDTTGFLRIPEALEQGDTMAWFCWVGAHRFIDGSGVGLFPSGVVPEGRRFRLKLIAAGRYILYEQNADGSGTKAEELSVPMYAVPTATHRGQSVRVTWATDISTAVGNGPQVLADRYEIEMRVPGSSRWALWQTDVVTNSARFRVLRAGTYLFRARVWNLATQMGSGWSPVLRIAVSG